MRLKSTIQRTSKKAIRRAGLLLEKSATAPLKAFPPSVCVGGWQSRFGGLYHLNHNGMEPVLACAPCRSGKTTGLVIPTLLTWHQSAVIYDPRNEFWALTAGWRQQHAKNKVLRFEPASAKGSVRWNPLDEICFDEDTGLFNVGDVQNLATLIVDPDGKGLESHWQKTAFALLVGIILHVLYLKKSGQEQFANLATVDSLLFSRDGAPAELWKAMIDNRHNKGLCNAIVAAAGQDMRSREREESGSVLLTIKSYLELYREPIIQKNIEASDFLIKDLMNHDSPASLYIVTEPCERQRLRPLLRMLMNMIIQQLAGNFNYKHSLLLMLDEAPTLGRLSALQESLPLLAKSGIKCYLICQDLSQLESREIGYGKGSIENFQLQIFYPPNRIELANYLSVITGKTAKQMLNMSASKKDYNGDIEISGDMVVYIHGFPAIYGKQSFYFKDTVLSQRSQVIAPEISDTLIPF